MAICHHHRLAHLVVMLICRLGKPSEKQWNKWNQPLIYLDLTVKRVKALTARCKVAFFLDSSSPGVPDWAWMFKSPLFHFQPMCILCYVAFHRGLFSHPYTPNTSAGMCQVTGSRLPDCRVCVQPSCSKRQCRAMTISPAGLSTECALAYVSGKGAACSPNSTNSSKLTQRSRGRERGKGTACLPSCLLHCPCAPGSSNRAASAVLLSAKAEEAPCILTKEHTCQRKPRASIRIQLPELERPRHSHSPSVCHVGKWEKCNTSTWSIDRYWIGADVFPA